MTISAVPLPSADRPRFFPGQILAADDLTAAHDVDAGLRQLHHRMLHGWGIASGLGVTGRRGDTSVSIGSGYALDSTGRELVVADPMTVPVPPVAAGPDGKPLTFTLVLRWTPDKDAIVVDRPGACGAEGAVRRSDIPQILWLDPAVVLVGFDIVLAVVQVQGCKLAAAPELALRRLLNPPPTPYAASGHTTPDETGWLVRAAAGGQPYAVSTEVDTSEAGFGDTPAYLARLDGIRLLDAALSPNGRPTLLDGTPYVEAAEPGRFRFVVPLPPGTGFGDNDQIDVNSNAVVSSGDLAGLLTTMLQWSVEWIGLQS
jgi:hypothetical protein